MKYTVPGFIELHGVSKEILDKLEEGDSIQDMDGKGRIVVRRLWQKVVFQQ